MQDYRQSHRKDNRKKVVSSGKPEARENDPGHPGHPSYHPRNFDEARMLANVNTRAQRLYRDGYRARRLTAHTIRITSPQSAEYTVDQANQDCDCPFFVTREGRYPCKHLLGVDKLLADQRAVLEHNAHHWTAFIGYPRNPAYQGNQGGKQ